MPLSDHYRSGMTERLLVRVITVDVDARRVEVVGKDAAVIQVNVGYSPSVFVWPREGEFWTVVRENGNWSLESKVLGPDEQFPAAPGEGEVLAEKIWTPSGDHLVVRTEMNTQIAAAQATLQAAINALKSSQTYTMSGFGTQRTLTASAMTIDGIATTLATLINDLKATDVLP